MGGKNKVRKYKTGQDTGKRLQDKAGNKLETQKEAQEADTRK